MNEYRSASSQGPFLKAEQAAAELRDRTGVEHHDVFVVLGSGWAGAADAFPVAAEVPMAEVTGHRAPSAEGHAGSFCSVGVGRAHVLIARGRLHLYEGYAPVDIAHSVRTAAAAGCRTVVLTNAAGAINAAWPAGSAALIRDHINFTGASPLTGPSPPAPLPGRFADMTSIYTPALRTLVKGLGDDLPEGVYVGFAGPQFETPAEIEAARRWGGDLVGMSTVLEAIAARHLGLDVLGLSLITNPAAGVGVAAPLDVAHITSVAEASQARLSSLLQRVIERIAARVS